MASFFENLKLSGGGIVKAGLPQNIHFALHRMATGRSQQHSLLGLNLAEIPQTLYEKIDLWIEWPAIPDANTTDYKTWIENIITFMNTFNTETIVLRFGYNPFLGSNWPPSTSTSTDYDNYYNNWITRYKSYEISSKKYSIKRILDETSVKTLYFLVDSAPDDISGYKAGIHYLNYLLSSTGKWKYFNTKVKTGICIEVEAFISNSNTDTTYAIDTAANNIAKKISYLLKNYNGPGTTFPSTNIRTTLGASNLTLDNDSVLAATGSPTQGKSINRIVDSGGNLIIKRYFGQLYNMTTSPPSSPLSPLSNYNQPIIQYIYNNVKLVDTDKSNYWGVLSLETDKLRRLNSTRTGWQTPTTVTPQLGLLYQNKWSLFNKLINQLKSQQTTATKISGSSTITTNVNGFSGFIDSPPSLNQSQNSTTYINSPLQNIMVFSSDFIEQVSNSSTDLTSKISAINANPLF